jgi:hypothetical protein
MTPLLKFFLSIFVFLVNNNKARFIIFQYESKKKCPKDKEIESHQAPGKTLVERLLRVTKHIVGVIKTIPLGDFF